MTIAEPEAAAGGAAAEVVDVTVAFGGVVAVDGVSLQVKPREIRGLIGPNGAGKSTLVNVLAGVIRPQAGQVFLGRERMRAVSPQQRAKRGLARTFQAPTTFGTLTLGENFDIARRFGRARRAALGSDQRAWVDELIGRHGFEPWVRTVGEHVPYPVQKLADTVRAIQTVPDVLVVDEPAAGLPVEDRQAVVDIVTEARDVLGCAVLIIDHDVPLMFRLCDYISVLNGGRLIAEGSPNEVAKNPDVIRAYLGEPM